MGQMTTHRSASHRLPLAILVALCVSVGLLVFGGAPALARTSHTYESQITEVPASSGAPVTGLLNGASAMTVFGGGLYVTEVLDGGVFRADEFEPSVSTPGGYEFVSQLPQLLNPNEWFRNGIAFGTSVSGTEMYLGNAGSGSVAAFGAGICGKLECASLQETWTGTDTPSKSFEGVHDVAVDVSVSGEDWAKGDVFVAAGQFPHSNVIDVFKPEAGGKEKYVTQITGPSPSSLFHETSKMAVSGFNGDVVVVGNLVGTEVSHAFLFKPEEVGGKDEYSFVGQLTPPGLPEHGGIQDVAVDSGNGEIYVATESVVYEFNRFGVYIGDITSAGTPEKWARTGNGLPGVVSLAVDPVSHRVFVGVVDSSAHSGVVDVFGPDVVIPDVESEAVSNVRVESGTHTWGVRLNGTVDADGAGPARCWFVWGLSKAFGEEAACADTVKGEVGEGPVAVHANLSGLEPGTTYYYRLQAENKTGKDAGEESQDLSFTTPGPGLGEAWSSEVSSSSVRLHATIVPHGKSTSYRFEYDTSPYVRGEAPHGTSVPPAGAGAGSSGEVAVEQHAEGLSADTAYHYRVVATSEIEPGVFEEFDGPDRTFTTQRAGSPLVLPDGRQWEQVSPVDKHGAVIRPIGESALAQASADGSAFTYLTSIPPEAQPQGLGDEPQNLAVRGAGGWSSVDIGLAHKESVGPSVGHGNEYRFFSEDLSLAVVEPFGPFTSPEYVHEGGRVYEAFPPVSERSPYLRHDLTCEAERSSCLTPLVTGCPKVGEPCGSLLEENADVPAGTEFGGEANAIVGDVNFVGATPDAKHVVVSSKVALREGAPTEALYEWSAEAPAKERLGEEPVSILPESEGGKAVEAELGDYGSTQQFGRRAISDDGSRIFFSTGNEDIYMRDLERKETVRLGHGLFQVASAEGSTAFFTEGSELYKCEIKLVDEAGVEKEKCILSDLTPVGAHGENAGVQGAILADEDGGYVYFVADGVLAQGATPGECQNGSGGSPAGARCNLYVSHDGVTRFVAELSADDAPDWGGRGGLGEMTSRVSPDGEWLAFMSDRSLTGYDNHDAVSGMPDEEVYLYHVSENLARKRVGWCVRRAIRRVRGL